MKFIILLIILSYALLSNGETFYTKSISVKIGQERLIFEIHYEIEDLPIVARLGDVIISDIPEIVNYFAYLPNGPIHIVFNRDGRDANGQAILFPRNLIELNPFPPVGVDHLAVDRNWLRSLFIHEFIHIIHMDLTLGWVDTLRTFVGSTAKFGGVVPRWFSEGIAVWGESHFTKEGRLRERDLAFQLAQRLADKNFCQTVDCLDAPADPPFGAYPYWVGGFFIDFLERKKTGTIRCMVRANASYLPFFLAYPFEACTGKSVNNLFEQFKREYIQRFKMEAVGAPDIKLPLNDREVVLWERGFVVTEKYIFVVIYSKDKERLLVSSWQGERVKVIDFKNQIENLQRDIYQNRFVVVGWMESFDNKERRVHALIDTNTLEIKIDRTEAVYLLPLPESVVYLNFIGGRWEVFDKSKILFKFPSGFDLYDLRVIGNSLAFLNFHQGRYCWYLLSLKDYALTKVFELPDNMFDLGRDDNTIYFGTQVDILALTLVPKIKLERLDTSADIISIAAAGNKKLIRRALMKNSLQRFDGVSLSKKNIVPIKPTLVDFDEVNSESDSLKSPYHSYNYFRPNYLFVFFDYSPNLQSLGASTSLNDPLDHHKIGLSYNYYLNIKESGGGADYTYSFNDSSITLGGQKSYNYSYLKKAEGREELFDLTFTHDSGFNIFSSSTSLSAQDFKNSDFISDRQGGRLSIWQQLAYNSDDVDLFVDRLKIKVGPLVQKSVGHNQFYGIHSKLQSNFRFSKNFKGEFDLAYSRFFKDGLSSGVIFGGGAGDLLSGDTLHQFYGVEANDLFGNELTTSRIQLSTTIRRPHRGFNSFPFFPLIRKSWSILYGLEYTHSQWIYIGDRSYQNDELYAGHLGVDLQCQLAYYLPTSMQLTLAQNFGKGDDRTLRFLLNLDTSFLP